LALYCGVPTAPDVSPLQSRESIASAASKREAEPDSQPSAHSFLLLAILLLPHFSFYFHDPDRKTETGETVGEAFFPTSVVKRVSPPRYLYQQPLLPQCSLES